jgi:tRNA-dihydrouridine synthase
MKFYLAPMEGVTGYLYRSTYHQFFHPMDAYYTPFIVPTQNRKLTSREKNDILPENNQGMKVIPQILTNKADDFIWAANEIGSYGYREVNLNLGCPSGTVVSKGRGSGFLADPEKLDQFLDAIFSGLSMTKSGQAMEISVKTRIGKYSSEEFPELMEIFNKYPIKELTIHPRVQKDFYRNKPDMAAFAEGARISKIPVCYNGNIFTAEDYENFIKTFPDIDSVMVGRGLIGNPGLVERIVDGKTLEKQRLKDFHNALLNGYSEVISGDRNVLFKMKELWIYMICLFPGSEKYGKAIRKSHRMGEYEAAVNSLFRDLDIGEYAGYQANE